jgi:hypothetical protein
MGKTKKKNMPRKMAQDVTIAELRSKGLSCRDIEKALPPELHLSHRQIARRLKQDDIKKHLDDIVKYYATYYESIGQEFMRLCLYSEDEAIRSKNIAEYHKIIGIAPTHAQSQFIQQIYVDNRKISDDSGAELRKLLEFKRVTDLQGQDTIDITPKK